MHMIAWWPTVAVLSVATFTDLRSRRIPNWLVLPFLVAGVIASGWLHGWHGIEQSFCGMGLGGKPGAEWDHDDLPAKRELVDREPGSGGSAATLEGSGNSACDQ